MEFEQCERFKGARAGYVFKLGKQGLGYYLDERVKAPQGSSKRSRDSVGISKNQSDVDEDEEDSDSLEVAASIQKKKRKRKREEQEEQDGSAEQDVSAAAAKSCISDLQQVFEKNVLDRAKHQSDPTKFADSEVALHSHINTLKRFASAPQVYTTLSGACPLLIELLRHENEDISKDVLELLAELLDAETIAENPESTDVFVETLLSSDFHIVVVENLTRLNEAQDTGALGVYHSMEIMESLLEVRENFATRLMSETKLLPFLLARISATNHDANKLYCSEVLGMLLTHSSNQAAFLTNQSEKDNMETLLKAASRTRKSDPDSLEEEECVANIFSALSSVLLQQVNRVAFDEMEGFDLMIRIVRQRQFAYQHALQAIAHGLDEFPKGCVSFIDAEGLPALFPLFMGRSIGIKTAKVSNGEDVEEKRKLRKRKNLKRREELELFVTKTVLLITATLFLNLTPLEVPFRRLLRKFYEQDMEKCDRLVELHIQYREKVAKVQQLDDIDEGEFYLARMDAGLEELRNVDVCIAMLMTHGKVSVRKRLRKRLQENRLDLSSVQTVIQDYATDLGEPSSSSLPSSMQTIHSLASSLAKL